MIGAIIFKLRAVETASLPTWNGRLMHAAFFRMVQDASPELSAFLHGGSRVKPFTSSMLALPAWQRGRQMNIRSVPAGTAFYWRVTALWEDLLRILLSVKAGYHVQAGRLPLAVEEVLCSPDRHPRSGILDEEELAAQCFSVENLHTITFHFLSPTSFRVDDADYAFPRTDLLFGSLSEKWRVSGFPLEVEKEDVQAAAGAIRLTRWKGRTLPVFFGRDRGTLSFRGDFTYDLTALSPEWQRLFLLLAQFAAFSGVGRLTGEGLGEVDVTYE